MQKPLLLLFSWLSVVVNLLFPWVVCLLYPKGETLLCSPRLSVVVAVVGVVLECLITVQVRK